MSPPSWAQRSCARRRQSLRLFRLRGLSLGPRRGSRHGEGAEPLPLAVEDKVPEPPRHLLETAVDTFERTFRAAGQGTVEVNRKLLDFTRANVSFGFDFAMSLASASSPVLIMQLQMSYWDEPLKVLASQAEELRALSADLVAKANEPIRVAARSGRSRLPRASGESNFRSTRNIALTLKERGGVVSAGPGR